MEEKKKQKKYGELSWKEKSALWKQYSKANPRSKIWFWISYFAYIMLAVGGLLIFINIYLQGDIWFGTGNAPLWYIGWSLLLLGFIVSVINIKPEITRHKKFHNWLEQEKGISKGEKQMTR